MKIVYFHLVCWLFYGLISYSALAMPCQSVSTPVEYTICNNDNLRWLNDVLYDIYQKVLVNKNTQEVYQQHLDWLKVRNSCTTDGCIERAYYQGIALLSDVDDKFDWAGNWWNLTATNGSGGNIQINEVSQWTACMNSNIWAGINHGSYRAEIRKTAGLGIVNHIADTSDCQLLLIPLKNASIEVYSNADWGCQLSMPKDVFIDGHYTHADKDPRSEATLFSLGIFTEEYLDKLFKQLVSDYYSRFVKTANVYVYSNDLDNMGAKVLSLWVRGMANKQAAIIMYTPGGKIWAACVEPDRLGELKVNYWSNVSTDKNKMPKTLTVWQQNFID
ncbi:hypothetical protein SK355_05795 [Candidatus Fukatsuia symbiotica]|uniref:Lysozyme inhibitor LprI N-terminal domain-containing protein n=1 Tax=Candidatus Fukatsuia symbiotica TaxID=1878942 RepID=A0A2U8I5S1_9GAMM|nr:hypothetical protein [Candidatus Fukatsuia symbiotica]AWK14506.1 hypothetical protein CCS41_08510 [Candidatus Fukatsuia symbiotica]MEA9444798.1 hypothetical protein [Candidatus Fukatsuia symbiotica]